MSPEVFWDTQYYYQRAKFLCWKAVGQSSDNAEEKREKKYASICFAFPISFINETENLFVL